MLEFLKKTLNKTMTENGATAYHSSGSECLDLFATIGALRNNSDEEIIQRFIKAYADDPDLAMKILFFARDIRGGLGERRVFRVILKFLAENEPDSAEKNIEYVAEYGRFDDLLEFIDTPLEKKVISYIEDHLKKDIEELNSSGNISLLAKWLPSINTSDKTVVRKARKIAKAIGMSEKDYRKTLSALRAEIKIIENNLREKNYTFDYEKQPSKALYKYRKAFIRNDSKRYNSFIEKAAENPNTIHTGTLTPYDIIAPIAKWSVNIGSLSAEERKAMDVTWNSLENYAGSDNSLVVVDGSGSMYMQNHPSPAAVAQSLGIYFAERNTGAFRNHFITFSANPRLVEVKGRDIVEKVRYCRSFNECSNTNLEKTFNLILKTALMNMLKKSDLPKRLIIISDMEFDCGTVNSDKTIFESARKRFKMCGYKLPQVVFWNVNSRNRQQPVRVNDQGVILVSGCSPQIFSMLKEGDFEPYKFMMKVLSSERYEKISA